MTREMTWRASIINLCQMRVKAAKIKQVLFWEAEESTVGRLRQGVTGYRHRQQGTYYCSLQSSPALEWGVDSLIQQRKKVSKVSAFSQNTHYLLFVVSEYSRDDIYTQILNYTAWLSYFTLTDTVSSFWFLRRYIPWSCEIIGQHQAKKINK